MELRHDAPWTLEQVSAQLRDPQPLTLADATEAHIQHCRAYLEARMARSSDPIYGINTGFGDLHNKQVAAEDMAQLQVNLVRSHACGAGETVDPELVRLMLLLKAIGLCQGHSGVQVGTVKQLLAFFNTGISPVVYTQGSLGASGDLAPLAHLTLGLMGEGEVWYNGRRMPAASALEVTGLQPIVLGAKEGLALLNGTQFMSAYATHILLRAARLADWADVLAALSLEAFDGRPEPFSDEVHAVRPHAGQRHVAARMRKLLEGSARIARAKAHVQDPYSFRCVPQVHGASRDALSHARQVVETEINAVTDNPTIFPEQDRIISAGNFHGQPLALVLDYAAIALAEFGSISERRVYKLISGQRGLPPFLTPNPGLNSGFMIPQYTAASVVSRNKGLCTPASVDTIDSSNGQEDHVSMGANAAVKCKQVLDHLEILLGIEAVVAAQAFELGGTTPTSSKLQSVVATLRETIPAVTNDVILEPLLSAGKRFVSETPPPAVD